MKIPIKKILFNWSALFFLLAMVFIAWSLRLIVAVNSMQDEVASNVALIGRTTAVEQSLRDMERELVASLEIEEPDTLRRRWEDVKSSADQAIRSIEKLPGLSSAGRAFGAQADSITTAVHQAYTAHREINGYAPVPGDTLQAWRSGIAGTIGSAKELVRSLRARSADLSAMLSEYWNQLTVLVLVSCALAMVVAVLLMLYQGKTKAFRLSQTSLHKTRQQLLMVYRSRSEMLSRVVEQLSIVMQKLNEVVEKQSTAMQEQSVALNQTTTTAQQIAVTSQQTTQKAEQVSAYAGQSRTITGKSKAGLDTAITAMEAIQAGIKETLDHITYLNEKTKQIDLITASVRDISKKTNILALNASIEATKAGAAGKGLTIVAHEVQALAERSQGAAQEISKLIKEVRQSAEASQTAIKNGYQAAEANFGDIRAAGEMMEKSMDMLNENETCAQEILIDSKQQTIGIDQMTEALSSINAVMQQIVLGTEDLRATMQSVDALTDELKRTINRAKGHREDESQETRIQDDDHV